MRYKERIIEHNLHKPREYHTDSLKLQEVDFDSSVISHHPKSFEYYFTHGLVVNDRRYIVKEFFVKHGKLYAILTEDEDTYYEMYLSFLDENVIEDLKKDISDLKAKDKQFDKRLSDLENARKQNQTLSINDRTISISNGNSIELPADKDTIYDDTALKQRVKILEDKPDKADQTLSINDRTISISNGNSIELPADKDTIYDDTALKQRVKTLEDKPDKADQTLSINDRTISISNGNSIELPADKDTIYDDTALKQRVKTLEDKPDKADQTLSINDRTISISGGNSIELPADKDTKYTTKGRGLFLDSDNAFHIEMGRDVDVVYPFNTNGNPYIKLSPSNRYFIDNEYISYAVDNDGTLNRDAVLEAGLIYDYEGSYTYDGTTVTFNKKTTKLSLCTTGSRANYVTGLLSNCFPKNVKFEANFESVWNYNNKVLFNFNPKIVWGIDLETHTEFYTHNVTKEELDSEEPIEIEVKNGETIVGNLTINLKNTRVFIRSVQGNIQLKNPTDNLFYNIPRLN